MFKKTTSVILVLLIISFSGSCSSSAERMDSNEDIVSDSGTLTRQELETSAKKMSHAIGLYLEKARKGKKTYVALLDAKNDTSEILPLNAYDNQFMEELRRKDIPTVRIKKRQMAMQELSFAQSGMTSNTLNVGKMAVPNYFIETIISETVYYQSGDRIMEQTITVEMINVETQLAEWSDRIIYRKKAASKGGGVTW